MNRHPMARDIDAAAKPDPIVAAHMIEKFDQADGARRAADEAVVQADRHELWVLGALLVQQIEAVAQILEKIIRLGKTVALVAAVVVGLV